MFDKHLFVIFMEETKSNGLVGPEDIMDAFWTTLTKPAAFLEAKQINWLNARNIPFQIGIDVTPRLLVYKNNNFKESWLPMGQFVYYETVRFSLKIPNNSHAIFFKLTWM